MDPWGSERFTTDHQARIEQVLEQILPDKTTNPVKLHDAMGYAVLGGGKRIRPLLVYASGEALGASPEALDYPACAVELIHAYSLIHDDLPAMDDDDLRRGKPSCHRAYGEAQAILAGDALQALAFKTLTQIPTRMIPADQQLAMVNILSQAAGSRGMVGGQAIDLDAVGKQLDIAQLENMHIHKTGALIRASVRLGSLCAVDASHNNPDQLDQLDQFGKKIGLAFQIWDDLLDVTGDTDRMGKAAGSDHALNKPTYPTVVGLDATRERADELHQEALTCLDGFEHNADPLRSLCSFLAKRSR